MQETSYIDREGNFKKEIEVFMLPNDGSAKSALRKRYVESMERVFGEGGRLIAIKQGVIEKDHPCPCGSGMKFGRCCEAKVGFEMKTGGH